MEHQYIERGNKQMYSVYHEPKIGVNDNTGIILCYPLGQEYIRCHKLYVNMANKLAVQGFHVLRFDYLGTGDSSCDFSSISINGCLEDIGLAINELKEVCGVSKIVLVGVRFGATLSLLYCQNHYIDKLVLWNPITDGTKYLKEITKEYNKWLDGSFTKEKKNEMKGTASFGFLFSPSLTKEIKSISFNKNDYNINNPILLIDRKVQSEMKEIAGITFEMEVNKEFWLKRENELGKSMVPMYELNRILDWINKL